MARTDARLARAEAQQAVEAKEHVSESVRQMEAAIRHARKDAVAAQAMRDSLQAQVEELSAALHETAGAAAATGQRANVCKQEALELAEELRLARAREEGLETALGEQFRIAKKHVRRPPDGPPVSRSLWPPSLCDRLCYDSPSLSAEVVP